VITVDTPRRASPPAGLRPERLTAIEELDYLLDRPAEPNLVLWEIHSHGHLDRSALTAAVTAVFGTDSGARRRLAASGRWDRHLYWRPAGPEPGRPLLTMISWRTPAELDALRERLFAWPIVLDESVVRIFLAVGPEHDVVILQVHHTAFDGVSSLRLLGTIAEAYRSRVTTRRLHSVPDSPPIPAWPALPTTPPTIPPAGATVPSTPPAASTTPPVPITAPDPLVTSARPAPTPARWLARARAGNWPGTVTRIAPQTERPGRPGYGFMLISVPVPRPAPDGDGPRPTVNDLLVAALCLTIDRWNAARGRASGQISVTIPVNGRAAGQRWQGDGNLSWLIRVATGPSHRADPGLLLRHVATQTRAARDRGRTGGTDAMSRLLATGWAPVVVKRRVARLVRGLTAPVLTDTSLVSNLGQLPDPPTFDGSGTETLWLAGPCPMPRGLCVAAVTVAGRLHLSVRYRLALLDQAGAEAFTACFRTALGELARPEPADPPEAPP
jgi:NRPS condensation-like uncharacterized protein